MKSRFKKLQTLFLCISLICNIVGMQGLGIQKAYAAADTKITAVTASASSESGGFEAIYAIDNPSEESYWSASDPGVSWLQLALDHIYYIDRWYVINVGKYYPAEYNTRDYELQGSLNGTTWTTIDNVVGNTSVTTNRSVAPFSAKYVRIYITDPDQYASLAQAFGTIVDFEVFATAPVVTSVEVPSSNNYSVGNALTFTVRYPAEITVNTASGTPYIPITIGTKTVNAVYKNGTGTQVLTFEYIVQSGDYDNNGITLGASINSNGGTIRDAVLNNANLTLNGVGETSGIVMDTRPRYSISIGALADGSISASVPSPYSTSEVVAGETINLNITPVAGKQMKAGSLKYNDGSIDHVITGTSFTMPAANVMVTAEFEDIPPTTYTVTVGALAGGSITANTIIAEAGDTIALTITPETGKQLKAGSLKYNDGSIEHVITGTDFIMPAANVMVTAEFEDIPPTTYTVAVGTLVGGSITASPTVAEAGDTIALTITPNAGKQLKAGSLKYNDGSIEFVITGTDFIMPAANVMVTAEFEAISVIPAPTYTVTIGTLTGGSITASPTVAEAGDTITLTIIPASGKQLKAGSLKYNDGSIELVITGTDFIMPAANVMVTAEFEDIPPTTYTVAVGTLVGGSITASPTVAEAGDTITLTIIPASGKQLKAGSLKYNDGSIEHVIIGTDIIMPAANVTVTAEFEAISVIPAPTYTVTIGTLTGGSITASPTVAEAGDTINITITPDSGRQFKAGSLKYNDGSIDHVITGTSFTMPTANVTVTAEFEAISVIPAPTYTITTGTLNGGSIAVYPSISVSGSSIMLTITPDNGKQLKTGSLRYNDGTQEVVITGTSFIMPAVNVTVTAEFEDIPFVPEPSTDTTLISIGTLAAITGVANGTAKSATALGLPVSVAIITSGGSSSASVVWDVASSTYNQNSLSAQSFTVTGSLSLPSGVVNINNVNLSITITVSVNQGTNPDSNTGGNSNNGSGPGPGGSNSVINTEPKLPSIAGSEAKGWNSVIQYIADNNTGSITVDMNGDTTITSEVLGAIKGKDVDLTLDLGNGIQWTIRGTDLSKDMDLSQLQGIDLNLSMNTDSIPAELLNTLPETDKVQIALAYDGSFGFTATLRLPLEEKNSGRFANLYYYNPISKKLELQAVGVVDKSGNVEFPFTHASDYVIVLSNAAMLTDVIDTITVTPVEKTLYIGGTKGSSVTINSVIPDVVQNAVSDGLCDMIVTYKSSNPKVATVSASGKVTAKKEGMITLTTTITINGVEKSCQTTIKVKKAYIKFTKHIKTMKLGETYTFQTAGYGVETDVITYMTSAKSIVTINKFSGKATAKSEGIDYVIAKVGNIEVRIKVVVQK